MTAGPSRDTAHIEPAIAANLTPQTLSGLFRDMLRIRMIEEAIAELYPEQQMRCPVHLSVGQEATPVGVCAHLARTDYVMSNHRSHGHYLAKGGDLKAMLAELYGKATGCTGGKGGSMHLLDLAAGFLGAVPIVGSTIPMAVGAAWGSLLRGEPRVIVAFFGEAAVEEGVFHEAITFAALKKLPIVFVCENNLYSVYSPMSVRQPANREVFHVAQGHGVPSRQGDGNDVLAVYRMAGEAIEDARRGAGPSFLEFMTYRWREHCGPYYDNTLGYRTEQEFEEWKTRCPIARFQAFLIDNRLLSQPEIEQMAQALRGEIEDAVAFAKTSPFPDRHMLMAHIYAS